MARKKKKLGNAGSVYKASDRDGYVISWMGADGKRKRKTIKAASVVQARLSLEDEKRKVLAAKKSGVIPAKDSFEHFAKNEFLPYQKGRISQGVAHNKLSAAEYERQRGIVEKHLIAHFGQMQLDTIDRPKVIEYIVKRTSEVSDGTVIKEVNTLKKLFNFAMDKEKVESSPATRLKTYMPKAPEGRTRYLEPEEWKAVFKACHIPPDDKGNEQVQWLQQAAALCLSLGTRRGELLHTTVPDVDLDARTIDLRKTKNGKPRKAQINDLAMQVLTAMGIPERKMRKDRGQLFEGVTPEQVSMRFIRACRSAGVKDFSLHDLRHTFASHLRMAGADLHDLKELLGHSDLRMTTRYAHLSQPHLAAAASRLNGVLTLPEQTEATATETRF